MPKPHILVVGGGAAGLIAAGTAAENGASVTAAERNPRMARKVMITGKGRCNLTNCCDVATLIANVPRNPRFLYSAFNAFTPQDMMALIEAQGVPLKVERGNRVFPISDKAVDVVDALVRFARDKGVHFTHGRVKHLRLTDGCCTGVALESGETLTADAVILATGGMSYPQTGSEGDGYALAREAGHTVIEPRPSLVPLTSSDGYCAAMQGLAPKNCALTVEDTATGKIIYRDFGEMLFTHFGVSGPMVLSASAHMRDMAPDRYVLYIDWKPALTPEQVDARLCRELQENANSDCGNMLRGLLPQSAIPVFAALAAIDTAQKCHTVTREQRHALGAVLKHFPVHISGTRPIAEAIITSGGVCVKEVQAATMASKLVKGLYFAGELLDVDAYTGGFNLQIAFSTGAAAGRGAAEGSAVL